MIIRLDPKAQLIHQGYNLYCGGMSLEERDVIDRVYPVVLNNLDLCFSHVKNKYYHNDEETIFNPLHVSQWTMFLYAMAHEISRSGWIDLCDKIYGISKMVSSADIFYSIQMPDIWFFDHPQGSVMGRAQYSDYFTFSQGCTVGNNKGIYPRIGKHVSMMSGSKIIGNCNIGHHVILASNSYVIDTDIEPYSIVFGENPNLVAKKISPEKFNELTAAMFDGNE